MNSILINVLHACHVYLSNLMIWIQLLPYSIKCVTYSILYPNHQWHPWWRHQMETFSALLALCAGNSPVTGEFPAQRPVTRSFDVFFGLRLNKRLSKQSLGWCLRRHRAHYDVIVISLPLRHLPPTNHGLKYHAITFTLFQIVMDFQQEAYVGLLSVDSKTK